MVDLFIPLCELIVLGGPGENPLTLESLMMTMPSQDWWPMDGDWDFHCGNPEGLFYNLRYFIPPLYAR